MRAEARAEMRPCSGPPDGMDTDRQAIYRQIHTIIRVTPWIGSHERMVSPSFADERPLRNPSMEYRVLVPQH